jgi:predicted lipoprotein
MRYKYVLISTAVFCTILIGSISSCKKKNKDTPGVDDSGFDRVGMLSNVGNHIIIPGYQNLVNAVDKLDSAITAFNAVPDNTNLINLQNIFKDVYRAWQYCSVFEIGPAETEYLRINCNTFPIDSNRINLNIANGTYNLGAAGNLAAKGFPGIDYLLFGTGPNNDVILYRYTTGAGATNRKKYLKDICAEIKTQTTNVLNGWLPGGGTNYLNTFLDAAGTDIGSSTGQLVNQLNLDYEVLKNAKIGIPLGKFSGGTLLPEEVEAYYSGISSELILIHLKAIEDIYLGKSSISGNGLGFDDYLIQLDAKASDGTPLNTAIKNQFVLAISKCQSLPDPLSSTVQNNTALVDDAYQEVQKLLVLLKNDMPSAMGVLITYEDTDGD